MSSLVLQPVHDARLNTLGLGEPLREVSKQQVEQLLQRIDACDFEQRAQRGKALGQGAYGQVDLYRIDGHEVAVKRATDKPLDTEAQLHWRATQCQRCSGNTFIVPLLIAYYCKQTATLLTVMPIYRNGTLYDEMERLRSDKKAYVALLNKRRAQGLQALQWLHEQCRMTHNDAHEENWFVTDADTIVLGDFGEARVAEQYRTSAQFEQLCNYESLNYRYTLSAEGDGKRALGKRVGELENSILSDPSTATDIAGKNVI